MSNFIIETNHLTKQYGEQKGIADLSIHVRKGSIYGLLGRNGAGKTTTMKMLLGLTTPTAGEIRIFGKNMVPPEKGNARKILSRIGSLIEAPGFYPNLTGTENLKIIARLRGIPNRDAIKNVLEVVRLPYQDKKLYAQYSLGMKQRLGIANAILHGPELLILDEPVNGLDPIGIVEVRDFIKRLSTEQEKTVLISSHILSEMALLADDIGIIDRGVLLEEASLKELEAKNSRYVHFIVTDTAQAARILETDFHTADFHIDDDHHLRLYDPEIAIAAVTRRWIESGLDISESHIQNDTLEDYFKRITGGEGIG